MSIEKLRTDQVYEVIEGIVDGGQPEFRPGDIAEVLREAGAPMLSWEIRGELSRLESEGLIQVDSATGAYSMASAASRKTG